MTWQQGATVFTIVFALIIVHNALGAARNVMDAHLARFTETFDSLLAETKRQNEKLDILIERSYRN